MGRYIDFLRQGGGGEDARTQELLGQPAMAGIAPFRAPTIADQDRTLSIDSPVADRDNCMATPRFWRFPGGRVDYGLCARIVEGAREHQENDYRQPLVQLANDPVERGTAFLAAPAEQRSNLGWRRPGRRVGGRRGQIGPAAFLRLTFLTQRVQHRRQQGALARRPARSPLRLVEGVLAGERHPTAAERRMCVAGGERQAGGARSLVAGYAELRAQVD